MTIELTPDQHALVKGAMAQGLYESEEAFVTKALRKQLEEDTALEHWLRTEVVPGHEEYLRDPSSAKTLAEARREILGE